MQCGAVIVNVLNILTPSFRKATINTKATVTAKNLTTLPLGKWTLTQMHRYYRRWIPHCKVWLFLYFIFFLLLAIMIKHGWSG